MNSLFLNASSLGCKEVSVPNERWPAEAIEHYDKFMRETKSGEWFKWMFPKSRRINNPNVKCTLLAQKGRMYTMALFKSRATLASKGVVTFQEWSSNDAG